MAKKKNSGIVEHIDSDIQQITITESDGIVDQLKINNCPNLVSIIITNANVKCAEILNCNNSKLNLYISILNSFIENLEIYNSNFKININSSNIDSLLISDSDCEYLKINENGSQIESVFGSILLELSKIRVISFLSFKIDTLTIAILTFERIELNLINCNHFKANQITGRNEIDRIFGTAIPVFNNLNNSSSADINLYNSTFNDSFELSNIVNNISNIRYHISISNVLISKTGTLQPKTSPNDGSNLEVSLKLSSIRCKEGLSVQSYIKNESIKLKVYIIYNSECEGILKFGNLLLEDVSMVGSNLKLITSFDQCHIKELNFRDFDNKSTVRFTNSDNIESLEIINSDLNDVIFRPLNVIGENIKIKSDSFLGGMKLYGSKMISLEKSCLTIDQKQEFYRQLKQAAKNSNNKFLELEYKAKEMEHYKPSGWGDKRSHWVNSLSDHGTNWVKPLGYIIYWNIIIWLFLMPNLYSDYFSGDKSYEMTLFGSFGDLLFGLFVLLNPLSRLNDFNSFLEYSEKLNLTVPILFFASKIINGILLYQMISAFRKWVGKD